MSDIVECDCGRGTYDTDKYRSCYDCFRDRRSDFLVCILCGRGWHQPQFPTCFRCRTKTDGGARDEAARDLRLLILHRDGYQCRECGDSTDLQVDHIRPCKAGGTADPWNLQVLCGGCNRDKGATWWTGCRWDQARHRLMTGYWLAGRGLLDDGQADRLRAEVERWRMARGTGGAPVWRTDWSARGAELLDQMERVLETEGDPS